MAPAGRLLLCEEKIRGKTGLAPHRGLAELRSLSLPGTYQEKITHLGNSLMNLTGLNSLDLSRNSLVSLEGMEYLAALQRLSVYHSRISSLAEVFRLHCLTELAEVEFRLHPVVESKSDYRLFVVRMLPRLRPLDDRPVRESERRASRLHLASEESLDSKQSFPAVFRVERSDYLLGRQLHVDPAEWSVYRTASLRSQVSCPLGQEVLVMDVDDEAALNLIAECGWGLSSPPGSTSSSQQEQEASFQRSKVCPKLHLAVPPGTKATLEVALLDLVGRHCSGCSPLHGSEVFLAQARHILSSVQEFTATQDSSTTVSEEISSLTMENKSLQSRLAELQQQYSVKMSEVVSELSDTRKEMDHLRQHLGRTLEESSSLKSLLFSVKKEVRNADAPSTLNLQITGFQTSVKRLSGEIVELKQRLEHYDRIQELTQMLQESRRYLVSTNEHLLRELGQVRAQHEAEVEPLHWSHRELKKTAALRPSARPRPRPERSSLWVSVFRACGAAGGGV
nr:LOW QUALITY PROTEIN: centrosomal protein of 72 kDa [Globicephala melas]